MRILGQFNVTTGQLTTLCSCVVR